MRNAVSLLPRPPSPMPDDKVWTFPPKHPPVYYGSGIRVFKDCGGTRILKYIMQKRNFNKIKKPWGKTKKPWETHGVGKKDGALFMKPGYFGSGFKTRSWVFC